MRYVAHAELLVLPSIYEGFGLPPIEAMACNVPVAVSRAASLPEVCGDAAAYFDPSKPSDIAQTILEITMNQAYATELRRRGLEHSAKYTWKASAERTLEIIRATLKS
jgi:glycosyltransferase involved in cell wall biosynthesis